MLDDYDIDLDDLESRLYCQVFHSNNQDDEIKLNSEDLQEFITPTRQKYRRYFQKTSTSTKYFNSTVKKKDDLEAKKMDSSSTRDLLESNVNDISKLDKNESTSTTELNQSSDSSKTLPDDDIKKQKRKVARIKRKQKQKLRKLISITKTSQELSNASNRQDEDEVICLSDSDADCVEIPPKELSLCVIDSDEDNREIKIISPKKEKSSKTLIALSESMDDVILVESDDVEEVINLDDDLEPAPSNSLQNVIASSNNELAINSCKTSTPNVSKEVNKQRTTLSKEGSPESTLNDFIDNSEIELNQFNFNFSLHGSDFQGDFLKPPNRVDTCETASSSSTTELHALKTIVFNEVEFPKDDIFSEANLESFGKYITPQRKDAVHCKKSAQNSPKKTKPVQQNIYSSSSESDFDETEVNCISNTRSTKNLPNLSVMQLDNKKIDDGSKKSETNETITAASEDKVGEVNIKLDIKKRRSHNSDISNKKFKHRNEVAENLQTNDNIITNLTGEFNKNDLTQSNKSNELLLKETLKTESVFNKNVSTINYSTINTQISIQKMEISELGFENKTCTTDRSIMPCNVDTNTQEKVIIELETNKFDDLIILDETISSEVEESVSGIKYYISKDHSKSAVCFENDIRLSDNQTIVKQSTSNIDDNVVNKIVFDLKKFSVNEILNKMSDDPKLWEIIHLDKINFHTESRGPRCNRCKERGHKAIRCTNKDFPCKCSLCGTPGHLEPRCPNKLCTQCGHKGNYITVYCRRCCIFRNRICQLCNMYGHSNKNCPDLWRRYHLTTEEGPLIVSKQKLKPKERLWCSGCAKSGHLVYSCNYYHSLYPPSSPFILSYADVYSKCYKQLMQQSNLDEGLDLKRSPVNSSSNYNEMNSLKYSQEEAIQFTDQLPNFISLHSNTPVNASIPKQITKKKKKKTFLQQKLSVAARTSALDKKNFSREIFDKATPASIKKFLRKEFRRIDNIKTGDLLQSLKKKMNKVEGSSRFGDYRKFNMLLFGFYKMQHGSWHLNILKQFQELPSVAGVGLLTKTKRASLYESYMYVCGPKKHAGVDYKNMVNNL